LLRNDFGATLLWASPSAGAVLKSLLPIVPAEPFQALNDTTKLLLASGGGSFLDEVKAWVAENNISARLVAIPSLWGSGAETSPVVVLNRADGKQILMGTQYLPYARVVVPDFIKTMSAQQAKEACGDVWAHAVEGFLSPLANDAVRVELASVIKDMLEVPLDRDVQWFDLSARACWGQARSGVGLVHGISHTLEGLLRSQQPHQKWGHAKLCSLFLWPVMKTQFEMSGKPREYFSAFGLDVERMFSVWKSLFDTEKYKLVYPILKDNWNTVLRDRCTRMNSVMIRHEVLARFENIP
jgi:alcohol dehydrogenase class IV